MELKKNIEPYEIVDLVLLEALKVQASDIYWLPGRELYKVRLRVEGLQQDLLELPADAGKQCIARLKVMSQLLTYRTKVSQDGVIHDSAKFANAEFRVAVMPTIFGERITVRVLDTKSGPGYLEELNFSDDAVQALKHMLARNSGLIVFTGPTGCGKTTSIYAMVRELLRNAQDPSSIISIEDPVECEIEGISQVSLSKASDEWDYPEALRAALRQDVKTLIIGEMRDKGVVKVALDAALTGHRIITTFHAGDIPSVYARMLHQGFEPFLIASALTGIISQRLVNRKDNKGRLPLLAYLEPDDQWKDFIIDNPGLSELRKKIKSYPNADLKQVAENMAKNNQIQEKDAFLI